MLLFMDGIDTYTEPDDMTDSGRWITGPARVSEQDARSQGMGFYSNAFPSHSIPARSTFVSGFALLPNTNANQVVWQALSVPGALQWQLERTAAGELAVNLNGGGIIATSAAGVVTQDTWHYIEIDTTINNATGSVEVWVDGSSVLTFGPGDTQGQAVATVSALQYPGDNSYDDLYCLDKTGTENNARLGDVRIMAINPASPGSQTDWVSNSLTNWRSVDVNEDADFTFNETGTPGAEDLHTFQDCPFDTGSILAVQVSTTAKRGVDATHDFRSLVRTGGTTFPQTTVALATTYSTAVDIVELNPDTAAAWTPAEVSAAEFGYELVT